ncbi:MAG TPA: hypothetical protein VKS21_11570, partial [Spirochaetota bacterium]|nr:hypothetical protein [Spirochaetota bacterium]
MRINAAELPGNIGKNEIIVRFNYPEHILFGASVPKDQYMNTSYLEKNTKKNRSSKYNFLENDRYLHKYTQIPPYAIASRPLMWG